MITQLLNEYENNREALEVIRLIHYTKNSVFLTGKAGTGKSTLLKKITSTLKRNFIILAPTGIAAINVGGQTIHSFFRIAPRPYLPNDRDIEYLENKKEILKNLDLIIIDEVSMVRADLLNAIDLSLRKNLSSNKPFAGIQLLMIGDLFQLPPVVDSKKIVETEILAQNYLTPYFFSSKSLENGLKYFVVELKKVYRQNDEQFIHLLNGVRENTISNIDLNKLNLRYNQTYEPSITSNEITLATTNDIVNSINTTKLNQLSSKNHEFVATVTGTFLEDKNISKFPTDKILNLKKDAQIMFIKNDTGENRRWVNGTLGKIIEIGDNSITIQVEKSGIAYEVERVMWEDIEYVWNKEEAEIQQNTIGTFTQFPIKLAWAVTIHKSQGQTFNKVIINLGNGAFTTGQTYVALSRCTTLEGITLKTKISKNDIKVDNRVREYLNQRQTELMENEKYNSIIDNLEINLSRYGKELNHLKEEKSSYLEENQKLKLEIKSLKEQLKVATNKVNSLANTNNNLTSLNQNLKTALEKQSSNIPIYKTFIIILLISCIFLILKVFDIIKT